MLSLGRHFRNLRAGRAARLVMSLFARLFRGLTQLIRTGFRSRRGRFFLLSSLLIVCFGASLLVSNWWVLRRASGRIFVETESAPPAGVAIVLGAAVFADRPSATLSDRLQCARELYRQGKAQHIVVSGDHGTKNYDEVATMKKWLVEHGVPASRVVADHAGFRTLDSMVRAHRIFGVRRAVICTQGFHLPRAVFLAQRAGIDATGVVSDRRVYAAHNFNQWRERLARMAAVFDAYIANTEPRYLGPIEANLQSAPAEGRDSK